VYACVQALKTKGGALERELAKANSLLAQRELQLSMMSRLAFTRYYHHQYCMVYGIHGGWGVGGVRILRNGRALVLQ